MATLYIQGSYLNTYMKNKIIYQTENFGVFYEH